MDSAAIVLPILLLVGAITGVLFSAVILRLSCSACGVDDPTLPRAAGIVAVICVATAAIAYLLNLFAGPLTPHPGTGWLGLGPAQAIACFALVPVNMLVATGIYRQSFGTSLSAGIRLWLTQLGLVACFALLLGLCYVLSVILTEKAEENSGAAGAKSTLFSPPPPPPPGLNRQVFD